MFLLKKFIAAWLMPVPLCLALLAAGLVLSRGGRRPRLGRGLILAAAVLLALLSNRFVSSRLLAPLESQYPAIPEIAPGTPAPAPLAGCTIIVVLGGGHSPMKGVSATGQLSTSALARITEGARLARALPGARLVVTGPGAPGEASHGAVLAAAARSLGVDGARITVLDKGLDTEDEAHEIAALAPHERVALVTSAWHMPRAASLFRKAGVTIVPCPVDFVARVGQGISLSAFGWDSESLEKSTRAIHERMGLLWIRMRGAGD